MALKNYNPTSPARRGLILVDKSGLYKGKPVKALTEGKTSSGGRNNLGRVTVRFRGGGHKRTLRNVDFKRREHAGKVGTVERIELRFRHVQRGKWMECLLESGTIHLRADFEMFGSVSRAERI